MKWPALILAVMLSATFFFSAGFGPLLEPLLYTMTPFERYYAGDYLASTWHKNDPTATTRTRLLWKARPVVSSTPQTTPKPSSKSTQKSKPAPKPDLKFETAFALERDVELRPIGDRIGTYSPEPFALSDGARAEGWTAVYRGVPQKIQSAQLERLLRDEVYGGEELWRFLIQPAVGAVGLIVLAIALRLWRRRLVAQYPWRSGRETAWLQMRAWSAASAGRLFDGMRRPMRLRELEGAKPEARRELSASVPQPQLAASVVPPAAPPPQPPAAPQPVSAPSRKAYVWDASEGID